MTASPDLTRQGIAALRAGDKTQATNLLHQATQIDPNNQAAWLWLSGCDMIWLPSEESFLFWRALEV